MFTSINPRRRALLLYIPQPLTVSIAFLFSIESLLHQTNIRDSAVIRVQAFSIAQNVPKWRQSVNKRSFSHGTVCTNKFKYLLGGPPFLDPLSWKRAPKITEGSTFDSHWPISRINPARDACHSPYPVEFSWFLYLGWDTPWKEYFRHKRCCTILLCKRENDFVFAIKREKIFLFILRHGLIDSILPFRKSLSQW